MFLTHICFVSHQFWQREVDLRLLCLLTRYSDDRNSEPQTPAWISSCSAFSHLSNTHFSWRRCRNHLQTGLQYPLTAFFKHTEAPGPPFYLNIQQPDSSSASNPTWLDFLLHPQVLMDTCAKPLLFPSPKGAVRGTTGTWKCTYSSHDAAHMPPPCAGHYICITRSGQLYFQTQKHHAICKS